MRLAIFIGESIRNALDILDEQPAMVLEAMTEHAKRLQQSGNMPKHRHELRTAIIAYLEQRLHEAQAREHQLVQAITGGDLSHE